MGPLRGIVNMVKEYETNVFFLNSISYFSLGLLTVTNFQFFGVFMIMGLSFSQNYFQYLSMSALLLFVGSIVVNKFSLAVYRS